MTQKEPVQPAFAVTCPKCGTRLRFSAGTKAPPRMRVQCSTCQAVFGVRRPGADAASALSVTALPSVAELGAGARAAEAADRTTPLTPREGAGAPRLPGPAVLFAPGEVLAGRYRVVRFIAQGGMGEVYEVDDLELGERVALKTVRPEVARDHLAIERFRREIQLARKVTHPNVCRIFDVAHHRPQGEAGGGTIFLTMELLLGETLAQRIRRGGSIPFVEALPIVRQIVAALDAAHQAGIVHRDLKPGNVMLVVGRGGATRAVVTDFGLARAEEAAESQAFTLTAGGLIGTPAYIAPEQVEGREITPAVDIYALGIVMYEMATGTVPFVADTALATAVKRLQEAPPSPRLHSAQVDATWEAAILRCLARDPAERFRSTPEVLEALAGTPIPSLEPAPAPQPAAAPLHAPWRRRLAAAGLGLVILLSFTVAVYRILEWRSEQQVKERMLDIGEAPMAPSKPVVARRSVAVLGFADRSGRPETAWLSGALSEMLGTELAAHEELRIVAGENVARTKIELSLGDTDSLAADTLGRLHTALGADIVVLGSYTALGPESGQQIRLDLRLQDARAGETISYLAETSTEAKLFELVSRVGARLSRELGVSGTAPEPQQRAAPPSSPAAARLYAEGLSRLRRFEPLAARDLLAKAVEADPENPLAHSGLADAWAALGYDEKAAGAAKTAFSLSRELQREERLLIEGRYRETIGDWPRAVEIYRTLWSVFPDDLDYGLRLAAAQTAGGQPQAALATAAALRALPSPAGEDPRIDLAEAAAAGALSDFTRQRQAAARAADKGAPRGARLLVAQARLAECRALRNLGEAERSMAACEQGMALYAAAGDQIGVADALTHSANVLFDQGDLSGARRSYEKALETYRQVGSKGAEAGALNNIAVIRKSQGEPEAARRMYEEVLTVCREIGSRAGEAHALNNIAAVYVERGDLARAREMFERSLTLRRGLEDQAGEAYALDNLGVVLRKQGDLPGARQRHQESLRIRRTINQKSGEAASLNNLGSVLLDQGELAAARQRFEEALALARKVGNRSFTAQALFGLGEVVARRGDLAAARARHEEALALRHELGERGNEAESRLALAGVQIAEGDAGQADALARAAAEEFGSQGAADQQALALALSARTAEALGDTARSRQAIDRATTLLATTQDVRARLAVAVERGRLSEPAQGAEALRSVLDDARRAGFVELQLEAALALAEVERARRNTEEAEARLRGLAEEARAKGYGLLAQKAAAAQAGSSRPDTPPRPR